MKLYCLSGVTREGEQRGRTGSNRSWGSMVSPSFLPSFYGVAALRSARDCPDGVAPSSGALEPPALAPTTSQRPCALDPDAHRKYDGARMPLDDVPQAEPAQLALDRVRSYLEHYLERSYLGCLHVHARGPGRASSAARRPRSVRGDVCQSQSRALRKHCSSAQLRLGALPPSSIQRPWKKDIAQPRGTR